ncbi:MAG: cobalamin biosynthesis protein CobN [Proteobacteria bacterium]|nr:cobalamin biosynthesis protein CobN [Pseudomonadota bacterium]
MCRNKLQALIFWLWAGWLQAAPLTVSLVLGDLDSQTALAAVKQLRADSALRDVRFAIYPSVDLASADRGALQASRLVFVQTTGRNLATGLAAELRSIAARGGRAYAVGRTWDADFVDFGLTRDNLLRDYMLAGGPDNVANMVRLGLAREFKLGKRPPGPLAMPEIGLFEAKSRKVVEHFEDYRKLYRGRDGAPWVAVLFYRSNALSGQTATVRAIARELEKRGLNALPVFGYPNELVVEKYLFDDEGRPRVVGVIALGMKIGVSPDKVVPVLERLGAPVLNAITLNSQSRAAWESSPVGLDIMERSWQVAGAEFAGTIAPTVVASKEKVRDSEGGLEVIAETPIPERVERIAERARRWADLRSTANPGKKVAVIYYNYPPGKENIGASYLNVLPRSLWQILERLRQDGYWAKAAPSDEEALFEAIRGHGANLGNWQAGAITALAKSGKVVLWPVSEYRKYFDKLPAELQEAMRNAWGRPEESKVSIWRDERGVPNFIFPAQRWGNLIFAPQPSRGWEQDVKKLYHDVTVPPHHQYLAFYLWLQHEAGVHAMVHVGTHATHEWHPGKEVGFTAADPGEIFVGAVPQLYPYIVDDIGEALQAKRRGMATIISHLTPPLDKAGLNPELKELVGLISDFAVAREKGNLAPAAIRADIAARAAKMGLLKDLGITEVDDAAIEEMEHHIKDIEEKRSPFGMHTFGLAPSAERRRSTAEAVLSLEAGLAPDVRANRQAALEMALEQSGRAELNALAAGLAGRYVAAGPGNDPIRNPASLPTGRNLFGFDPSRLPTPATYGVGAKLAEDLVDNWKKRHGRWPKRLVFNLWGVESSRHEGVMEAQIMALWGVKPVWDARGRVAGVVAIARDKLERPRVDVTVVPSGLYRDLFANLMKLLDEAASAAREASEGDNPLRQHVQETKAALMAQGVAKEEAEKLAAVRLFSVPSGAYGTNLDKVIPFSNTWESEKQVADVYFMRMSHAYGQGFWGGRVIKDGKVTQETAPQLGVDLFKLALKGAEAAIHSRSSNIYATLDNDDFFQYLGGTALAIRQVNGSTPEVLVTNMANPHEAKTETLEKYMGREMRSRYLNPQWIEVMLQEGYAGARFVNKVVEHLWGWTVTTPDKIDDTKWQEMYETYVVDRHQLGIRKKFREAGNMLAYQVMVDRMLTAVNKGYWKASPETVARLQQANQESIAEAGVACSVDTCSSPQVTAQAKTQDRRLADVAAQQPVPGEGKAFRLGQQAVPATKVAQAAASATTAPPVPAAEAPPVNGLEMTEIKPAVPGSLPAVTGWMGAVLLLLAVAGWGWRKYSVVRLPITQEGV